MWAESTRESESVVALGGSQSTRKTSDSSTFRELICIGYAPVLEYRCSDGVIAFACSIPAISILSAHIRKVAAQAKAAGVLMQPRE